MAKSGIKSPLLVTALQVSTGTVISVYSALMENNGIANQNLASVQLELSGIISFVQSFRVALEV